MYAKLENGQLRYAPRVIVLNGMRIANPTADQYAVQGWLPLETTEMPTEAGKTATATYSEQEGKIVQSWTLEPAPPPELTPDERIAALEEELAAAKILLGLEE